MQRAGTPHGFLIVDLVARPVRPLKKVPFRGFEPQPQRLHGDVEMRRLRSTDDGDVVVGTTPDPGHRDMRPAHAPARCHFAHAARDFPVDFIAVEFLIDVVGGARGAGVARQKSARERTEGGDCDALVAAVGEHLPFFLAVEHVVLTLHINERHPAVHRGDMVHLRELPRIHRRGAEVAHLAAADRVVQRLHRFLDGRVRIEGMGHVEIDVVGAHPRERPVDCVRDVLARQSAIIRVVAHRIIDLGCEHQPLACAHLEQVPADNLFVAAGGIPIGHVEKGDAKVESPLEDGNRGGLVEHPALPGGAAHRHRAEA